MAIFVPQGGELPPREVVYQPELSKYVRGFGTSPNDIGYAAIKGDTHQPVGAAWLRLLTGDNKGYGTVDETTPELSIAVIPEYRGRGIGTQLLKHLIMAAGERYDAISLSVWHENPAYRLYQRLGFEVVGENGPAVTMLKRLPGR